MRCVPALRSPSAAAAKASSLPNERRSKDPLRPRAQCDRDAELDQALRQLGDELLMQQIPERLLRVLRIAVEGPNDHKQDEEERPVRTRSDEGRDPRK